MPTTGRLRSLAATVCLVLGLGFVTSASAQAAPAPAWKPAVHVTPETCGASRVVWTHGYARGFVMCAPEGGLILNYVQGDGRKAFARVALPLQHGHKIFDVADDGKATYALFEGPHGLSLLTRQHTGQLTTHLIWRHHTRAARMVATHGKWWATWTGSSGGIWDAHTMGVPASAQRTLTNVPGTFRSPSLAVVSTTQVAMIWGKGLPYPMVCHPLFWALSSGAHRWSKPQSLHACGDFASITHADGRYRAVWTTHAVTMTPMHVEFAERSGGTWTTRRLPRTLTGVYENEPQVTMAVEQGTIAVAWTTTITEDQKRAVVAVRRGGTWHESLFSGNAPKGQRPQIEAGPVGLSGGKAQIVLTNVTYSWVAYDLVRRQ